MDIRKPGENSLAYSLLSIEAASPVNAAAGRKYLKNLAVVTGLIRIYAVSCQGKVPKNVTY